MQKQWGPLLGGLAPLILYYAADALFGRDIALAATVAWLAGEVAYYKYRGWPLTPLYWFAALVVLASVGVDVLVEHVTGPAGEIPLYLLLFCLTAKGAALGLPTFAAELAAQARRPSFPEGRLALLRLLLFFWSAVLLGTALASAWVAHRHGYAPAKQWLVLSAGAVVLAAGSYGCAGRFRAR